MNHILYERKFKENNIENRAFDYISRITLSSRNADPSKNIISFLQQYSSKVKTVYRGIGLIRGHLKDNNLLDKIDEINNLNEGDILPDYLIRNTGKGSKLISSYTKKLGLAKKYSEGAKSIVVEITPSKSQILLDLDTFAKIQKKKDQTFFDEEDLKYMILDKEVLVIEPVKAKIVFVKGKL